MSTEHDETSLCGRVLDRLVEGDDLSGDRLLAEHLRSCVTCFRALTELRDAPRMAEALRAETPGAPHLPPPDDRFWDELATRTTAAAESALHGAVPGTSPETLPGAETSQTPGTIASTSLGTSRQVPARRSSVARGRIISVAATLAAVAAGVMLVARGPLRSPSGIPATPAALVSAVRSRTTAPSDRSVTRSLAADATADEEADVAELDVSGLHRLLDRLRPGAPAALTASAGSGPTDAADVLGDDEAPVNEALADLDGDELRRVASSLGVGTL